MKFINFAIVKLSGLLVAGILTAHFFPIAYFNLYLLLLLFIIVGILWFFSNRHLIQKIYFGIAVYISFFAIGYFILQLRKPEFQPIHYIHLVSEGNSDLLKIKIEQSIKPDQYNAKYFAYVQSVNGQSATGKILLSISNDSLSKNYSSDEVLLVYAPILKIQTPLNPHEFNYAGYLQNLEIYGQLRVSNSHILRSYKGTKTVFGVAQNLRSKAVSRLKETILTPDERAIIQALVLGEKKDISKELYEEYAAAGAVHILAVSGLHVGIIYFILGFLFKPLKRLKYGMYIHSFCIVIFLSGFALLSGLSPSVTRAVTMFAFFAFAGIFGRRTNSLNTLFLSFLTLLLFNPLWLFQVGFQLSYSAVFFILWLNPLLYRITYSKYTLVRKVKGIVGVTISAQLGVLPLSLFYFHQFPGLFLLTNIVVLPILSVFMCGGIIIVVLAFVNFLPHWMAETYNFMVTWLNNFIHWVAVQDHFLFKDIHFSSLKVIGTYLLVITTILFFRKMNYRRLTLTLSAAIVLLVVFIHDDYKNSTNQLIVFHKSRQTLIANKNGKILRVLKKDSTSKVGSFPIKSYKAGVATKIYSEEISPTIFRHNQKHIVILDSLSVLPAKRRIHLVILTGSPKVNINRLIDSLKPDQLIADGSNFPSYVKRWQESCELKKLPFHATAEKGAFIMK